MSHNALMWLCLGPIWLLGIGVGLWTWWSVTRPTKYDPPADLSNRGCTLDRRHSDCWEYGCNGYWPCSVSGAGISPSKAKKG